MREPPASVGHPGSGPLRSSGQNVALLYLDRQLERFGDRPCFHTASGAVTYRELHRRVLRAAAAFAAAGIGYESRVVLILPDSLELVVCLLALFRLGSVPVPLATVLSPADYAFVLEDCYPAGAVVGPAQGKVLDGLREALPAGIPVWVAGEAGGGEEPFGGGWRSFEAEVAAAAARDEVFPVNADDSALIQYTSGSTGRPKGVVHLHRGVAALEQGFARRLALEPEDVCFSAAKMSFGYGLGNTVFFPLAAGASAVLVAEPLDPFRCFEVLGTLRPTVFFGVPSLYAGMLEVPRAGEVDLSHLRRCVSAGEHLSARLFERWKEAYGLEIVDGIGATECLHIFVAGEPGRIRPGSTGTLVEGYEARIVGDDEEPLAIGEPGHLLIRGETNAARFWNRHDETRRQMLGEWVRTGDLFSQDEEGYFQFLGRSDDILKVGGLKVSPTEVEGCVARHQAVQECAVVAHASEDGVTAVIAYVVPRSGWEPGRRLSREIKTFVRSRLAAHKCPREVRFVASLPRTSTGKTARFKLRRSDGSTA